MFALHNRDLFEGQRTVLPPPTRSAHPPRRVLLQRSRLAGLGLFEAEAVWDKLRVGDPVRLVRETGHLLDENAVAVYWRTHKLGVLPRGENAMAAILLDRGDRLIARIDALRDPRRAREPLTVRIEREVG